MNKDKNAETIKELLSEAKKLNDEQRRKLIYISYGMRLNANGKQSN